MCKAKGSVGKRVTRFGVDVHIVIYRNNLYFLKKFWPILTKLWAVSPRATTRATKHIQIHISDISEKFWPNAWITIRTKDFRIVKIGELGPLGFSKGTLFTKPPRGPLMNVFVCLGPGVSGWTFERKSLPWWHFECELGTLYLSPSVCVHVRMARVAPYYSVSDYSF